MKRFVLILVLAVMAFVTAFIWSIPARAGSDRDFLTGAILGTALGLGAILGGVDVGIVYSGDRRGHGIRTWNDRGPRHGRRGNRRNRHVRPRNGVFLNFNFGSRGFFPYSGPRYRVAPPPAIPAPRYREYYSYQNVTPLDQQKMSRALWQSLSNGRSGFMVNWYNGQSGHSGSATALQSYRNSWGQRCRNYIQTIRLSNRPQDTRNTRGTACKQADGSWG